MNITLNAQFTATTDTTPQEVEKIKPFLKSDLAADQLFVRTVRLTGNQINSQGGKFRDEDLTEVALKTIGAPVMIGHDTRQQPIGKFFDGDVQQTENGIFTVHPFYFPKNRSDANDLAANIDSGVLSEASIGFSCNDLVCGLCDKSLFSQDCSHFFGDDGFFYIYDDIDRVNEGSLVYRGAHPNTEIARRLADSETWAQLKLQKAEQRKPKTRMIRNSTRKINHG